ncbi:hypothetical protein CA601_10790 [Paraburkholderia hospita]|nr:hypothetical protein CA601_10790 [Paraburkholderia hospita]
MQALASRTPCVSQIRFWIEIGASFPENREEGFLKGGSARLVDTPIQQERRVMRIHVKPVCARRHAAALAAGETVSFFFELIFRWLP